MRKHFRKTIVVATLVVFLLALTVSVAAASGGSYYTVRHGDTLFKIGRYYGVNPYKIAEANHLPNPNCIYTGQVLYIPSYDVGHYPDRCQSGCYDDVNYDGGYHGDHGARHHVVRKGETLTRIAYYYGVSPWAIAKANGLHNPNYIYAGQVLYIPAYGGGYHQGGYHYASYSY